MGAAKSAVSLEMGWRQAESGLEPDQSHVQHRMRHEQEGCVPPAVPVVSLFSPWSPPLVSCH